MREEVGGGRKKLEERGGSWRLEEEVGGRRRKYELEEEV